MISRTKSRRKRNPTKMGDGVGDTRYTTAITQALCSVACGVALRAVMKHKLPTEYPIWALGSAFCCCVLGALVYGVPQLEQYRTYHSRANFLVNCVVVPLLSTHFAIANKYDTDMSYILLVLPIFPMVAHLVNDRNQFALQDGVVGSTLAFQAFMHFQTKNYYGLAYCASYAIFHFFIGSEGKVGDIPAINLQAIGFIFNQFFITKALDP